MSTSAPPPPSVSSGGIPAPGWIRALFLTAAGATTVAAPWMLGSESLAAQKWLLRGAVATLLTGIAVWFCAKPGPDAKAAWRVERWVLLLGLLFLGLVAAQALNPSHRVVMQGNLWRLDPVATQRPGPHSLAGPFDGVPGDFLPFKNSWRYLLIFGTVWVYAAGLAIGLVERKDARTWATIVGVNGVLLAVTCIVHRAMGEPLTLWHYGSTFDFTGSPVFLYKNHNGAYLAASMAAVLGLAASARGWIGRLLWETAAIWVWGATLVVNSRVATGCATAWAMIYLGRLILTRTGAQAKSLWWARVVVAGACAVALTIVLESGGGVKALKRFAPLASTPGDFLQGGHFRVMLREVGYYMWRDSPVWGWGGGSYLYLYNTYHVHVPALAEQVYREQPQLNRFFGPTANCDWIEFAVEYGAVGVGLMAAMALIPFAAWCRWRGWSEGLALFLVLGGAGLVAHAYFDYILRNPALLMLGAGLLLTAHRISASTDRSGG